MRTPDYLYKAIFSEEEYLTWELAIRGMNLYYEDDDDPSLLEYEKQWKNLYHIFNDRCENWSSENYFVTKENAHWILWIKDPETGVALDVQDTFRTAWEACWAGISLEKRKQLCQN